MGHSKHESDGVPNYPKDEIVWERYYNEEGDLRYVVTSKKSRDYYFLYEWNGEKLKKLSRSKTPDTFEDIIEI